MKTTARLEAAKLKSEVVENVDVRLRAYFESGDEAALTQESQRLQRRLRAPAAVAVAVAVAVVVAVVVAVAVAVVGWRW